jgi:hypothetical protein
MENCTSAWYILFMTSRECVYMLTDEQQAGILEALEMAKRGDVASDAEAAAVFRRLTAKALRRTRARRGDSYG